MTNISFVADWFPTPVMQLAFRDPGAHVCWVGLVAVCLIEESYCIVWLPYNFHKAGSSKKRSHLNEKIYLFGSE